jgi:putative transcriptional regulator
MEVIKMEPQVIAKRLLQLRGEKTREEVAYKVGISVSALTMYETGNRIPRDEIKLRLARYYNTSVEAIFFAR